MVYRAEQRGIISNGVKKTIENGEPSFVPASALVALQFNPINKKSLFQAQKNPEIYRDRMKRSLSVSAKNGWPPISAEENSHREQIAQVSLEKDSKKGRKKK